MPLILPRLTLYYPALQSPNVEADCALPTAIDVTLSTTGSGTSGGGFTFTITAALSVSLVPYDFPAGVQPSGNEFAFYRNMSGSLPWTNVHGTNDDHDIFSASWFDVATEVNSSSGTTTHDFRFDFLLSPTAGSFYVFGGLMPEPFIDFYDTDPGFNPVTLAHLIGTHTKTASSTDPGPSWGLSPGTTATETITFAVA